MHSYYARMPADIRLDAEAVKVLAHPLRSRLLTTLRRNGPATATELADQLDTNTGATSYHLRKLESVGLVEDTGEGAGKRREWRAASRSHSWAASDFAGDEDAEASLAWLTRDYVRQAAERMQGWLDVEHGWPQEWRDAMGMSDDVVEVTAAQAEALIDDLLAVLVRYRTAGTGDPEARQVSVAMMMRPVDPRHG
jgi:predicted ArsR family transcriptional regulator